MNDNIHLAVPDFEPANASAYELLIEIGDDDHNYAVIDPLQKAVKVVSYIPAVIFNQIEGTLLQSNFARTKISLNTQKFTFIPKALYQESDLPVYSNYLKVADDEAVFTSSPEEADFVVVYALKNSLLSKVNKYFDKVIVLPQITPYFTGVEFSFSHINDAQLFVNIKPGDLEIVIFNEGRFLFYNQFEYANDDEILYFMLLAIQQHQLEASKSMVKLSGATHTENTYQKIKNHFQKTELVDQESLPLTYDGLYGAMPRFFSLLSLHLCG